MAYKHNDALHKHQVRAWRYRKFAIIIVVVLFLVGGFVLFDWLRNQVTDTETIVSSEVSKTVQSANVSVYRSEYFQFQAPEDWIAIENQNAQNEFVYVKNKGNLITQRLVVYINRPVLNREADFKGTHVLPVRVGQEGTLESIGEVGQHCDTSWPENVPQNPTRIVHESVSMVCSAGSKQYNVVVGEFDGDDVIDAKLKDGRAFTYSIVYSDLTAYPSPGDIYNIVSSFTTL